MNESIQGKTALITGCARRLGRAMALGLAQYGANIIVHYNSSEDDAQDLEDKIKDIGVEVWKISADLTDKQQVKDLIKKSTELAGPIDILINNASIFNEDTVYNAEPESIEQNILIHAAGPLILSRDFAAQNRIGHVINILDSRIHDYDKNHVSYHLSKRTLHSITKMLALELGPYVAVNAVAPGLILPPEGYDETYLEKLANTNPLNRFGCPRDIVDAMLYLLNSSFVTGQVIYVDGGRNLKGDIYG